MSRHPIVPLVALALLILSADRAAVAAEPEPLVAPAGRHVLLVTEGGGVRSPAPGAALSAEDLSGVDHAWVWTPATPPRKLGVDELSAAQLPPRATATLRVVVPLPATDHDRPRTVIAAPQGMWEEVPEDRLPSFAIDPEASRLDLTIDPELPWRLRVLAPGRGSWWVDLPAGVTAATVAPVVADDVELRVVAAEHGPRENARISVLAGNADRGDLHKLADFRTDDEGGVVIPALPDLAEVVLLVSAQGHAPASVQGLPSRLAGDLVVEPGATVRGRFVSEEGLPLTGVRVRIRGWVTDDLPLPVSRVRTTEPDGGWQFSSLPSRRFELSADLSGMIPWSRVVELRRPERGDEPLDLGNVTLGPAHEIAVTVVDDTGVPVPGAQLQVDGRRQGSPTDGEGRAWIDVAPARSYEVTASSEGHRPGSRRLTPPLPHELGLELTRAFLVRGTFVDTTGNGIPDGRARVLSGRRLRDQELGGGGSFELELEPGEPVRVELRSPRTTTLELSLDPGMPGEVRDLGVLVAPPGMTVTGRLLRSDTAEPVAGARIWVPRPSEQGPLVAWVLGDLVETRSDADGVFELTGLPAMPVTLRIEAAGLARLLVPVVPEADDRRLDLGDVEVAAGSELVVRLVEDAEDRRTEGRATAVVDLGGHGLGADLLRAPVIDGVARLSHVPPGEASAAVFRDGRFLCEVVATVEPDQDSTTVECHNTTPDVTGRVEVGGHPAGPGLLSWMQPTGDSVPEVIMNFGDGALRQQQVFTPRRPDVQVEVDDRGRFSTRDLRPGRWPVLWIPFTGATAGPIDVTVPAADAFDTVLRYPGHSISGVVVDAEGLPVEGARVRRIGGAAFARSGADGSFVLAGLEPGVHRLQARAPGGSGRAEVLVEADHPPHPVELVLRSEEPNLAVTVVTDAGLPAAGALVFLESAGRPLLILTADANGRAAVTLQPPMPRLRAAAHHRGRWVLGDWTGAAAVGDEPLTLTLPEAGSLLVVSETTAGRPSVTGPGGWDLTALLSWLGTPPSVGPASPLLLPGLPPGRYTVTLDGASPDGRRVTAEVEDGEVTEIEID